MDHIISTHQLSKSYGKFAALKDINLNINRGEIFGLIGRNGAGKTTLINLILGLIYPSAGEVVVMGASTGLELREARSRIGFLAGNQQYAYMSARQNLTYHAKLNGICDKSEIDRCLRLSGLGDEKKIYRKYSTGMKQRLGVAQALMGHPDLVILDEPTNGLDPIAIVELRDMIHRINREEGITFIVSSHILSELSQVATQFGFIEKGNLLEVIDQKTLHDRCRSALEVHTGNASQAAVTLEQKLNVKNYRVEGNNTLLLYEYIEEPARISKVLFENGNEVNHIAVRSGNLEEYFINLIGGEHHV